MTRLHRPTLTQWHKIEALVRVWLEQRQRVIVLLCTLQGLEGLDHNHPRSTPTRVQEFCQLLMDYISAGYFEVYRELVREARQLQGGPPLLVAHVLERLQASTLEALAFNQDYDTSGHSPAMLELLPQRLARLTEVLEDRFSLEDRLILSMHQQRPPRSYRRVMLH